MNYARKPAETFSGDAISLEWPRPNVALVTLTRHEDLNAITLELITELTRALAISKHARASAMIITGVGRAFCAGAHLKLFRAQNAPIGRSPADWRDRYLGPVAELFDSLEEMPFPVIAAINGYALGGGAELALSADFRLMADNAIFGLPETKIGASPGAGGVQKLIRHVGRTKALEWILLGEHLDANTLNDAGLLYQKTTPDALLPSALALAEKFTALSPAAVAQAKKSIYVSEETDLRTARRFGLEALTSLMSTTEWREGTLAFIEKRKPQFREED